MNPLAFGTATPPAIICVLALLSGCASPSADVVYTNGRIYTVNEAQPWVEAVAIMDGTFLVVGSNADVEAVTGEGTEVVDLEGRMAMPGLVDTHNHSTAAAMSKANLYLSNPNDQDEMLAEIKAYADANPDLPFIRGEAWNMGVFPDNCLLMSFEMITG